MAGQLMSGYLARHNQLSKQRNSNSTSDNNFGTGTGRLDKDMVDYDTEKIQYDRSMAELTGTLKSLAYQKQTEQDRQNLQRDSKSSTSKINDSSLARDKSVHSFTHSSTHSSTHFPNLKQSKQQTQRNRNDYNNYKHQYNAKMNRLQRQKLQLPISQDDNKSNNNYSNKVNSLAKQLRQALNNKQISESSYRQAMNELRYAQNNNNSNNDSINKFKQATTNLDTQPTPLPGEDQNQANYWANDHHAHWTVSSDGGAQVDTWGSGGDTHSDFQYTLSFSDGVVTQSMINSAFDNAHNQFWTDHSDGSNPGHARSNQFVISNINFNDAVAASDSANLFGCLSTTLSDYGSSYVGTSFSGNLDTAHVKNMSGMFASDKINDSDSSFSNWLSEFNTSNVQNMSDMFSHARFDTSDTSINPFGGMSNWDVHNVVNMDNLFSSVGIYRSDNGSGYDRGHSMDDISMLMDWNTKSLVYMNGIFGYQDTTDAVSDMRPLSDWNVSNLTSIPSDITEYASSGMIQKWWFKNNPGLRAYYPGMPPYEYAGSDNGKFPLIRKVAPHVWNFTGNPIQASDKVDYYYDGQKYGSDSVSGITGQNAVESGNNMPAHFRLADDGSQDLKIDGGEHTVNIKPALISDTVHYMYNSQVVGSDTVVGNYDSDATEQGNNMPYGYELAGDGSENFTLNGTTHNVNVKQKICSDEIDYIDNGNVVGNSIARGRFGKSKTIRWPGYNSLPGFRLANDGTQMFTIDGQTHDVNVIPSAYDNSIHYVYSGNDPDDAGMHGSLQIHGNYDSDYIAGQGIDYGYQLADDGTQTFKISSPGTVHIVHVVPASETDTVNYISNGKTVGTYRDTQLYNTKESNFKKGIPSGFNTISDGTSDFYITGRGNGNTGIHNVNVAPELEAVTVHYVDQTGQEAQNQPIQVINGYTNQTLNFNYGSQKTQPPIDQTKRVQNYRLTLPMGYTYDFNKNGNPNSYTFTTKPNQSLTIYVKGDAVDDTKSIFQENTLFRDVDENGNLIHASDKNINLTSYDPSYRNNDNKVCVGDTFDIPASAFTPDGFVDGYQGQGLDIKGRVTPSDIQPAGGTLEFTAVNQPVSVQVKNQAGTVVKSYTVNGYINQHADLSPSGQKQSLPNGYMFNSKQNVSYTFPDRTADRTFYATGANERGTLPVKATYDNGLQHRTVLVDVSGRYGDLSDALDLDSLASQMSHNGYTIDPKSIGLNNNRLTFNITDGAYNGDNFAWKDGTEPQLHFIAKAERVPIRFINQNGNVVSTEDATGTTNQVLNLRGDTKRNDLPPVPAGYHWVASNNRKQSPVSYRLSGVSNPALDVYVVGNQIDTTINVPATVYTHTGDKAKGTARISVDGQVGNVIHESDPQLGVKSDTNRDNAGADYSGHIDSDTLVFTPTKQDETHVTWKRTPDIVYYAYHGETSSAISSANEASGSASNSATSAMASVSDISNTAGLINSNNASISTDYRYLGSVAGDSVNQPDASMQADVADLSSDWKTIVSTSTDANTQSQNADALSERIGTKEEAIKSIINNDLSRDYQTIADNETSQKANVSADSETASRANDDAENKLNDVVNDSQAVDTMKQMIDADLAKADNDKTKWNMAKTAINNILNKVNSRVNADNTSWRNSASVTRKLNSDSLSADNDNDTANYDNNSVANASNSIKTVSPNSIVATMEGWTATLAKMAPKYDSEVDSQLMSSATSVEASVSSAVAMPNGLNSQFSNASQALSDKVGSLDRASEAINSMYTSVSNEYQVASRASEVASKSANSVESSGVISGEQITSQMASEAESSLSSLTADRTTLDRKERSVEQADSSVASYVTDMSLVDYYMQSLSSTALLENMASDADDMELDSSIASGDSAEICDSSISMTSVSESVAGIEKAILGDAKDGREILDDLGIHSDPGLDSYVAKAKNVNNGAELLIKAIGTDQAKLHGIQQQIAGDISDENAKASDAEAKLAVRKPKMAFKDAQQAFRDDQQARDLRISAEDCEADVINNLTDIKYDYQTLSKIESLTDSYLNNF